MEFCNIILQEEGRIATLYINRPKALNALNEDTLLDIKAAVEYFGGSDELDVLIITGAGRNLLWPVPISVSCRI